MIEDCPDAVDQELLKYFSWAFVWWQAIAEIARLNGVPARDVAEQLPAALLAPDVVESIIDGRQPPGLTVAALRHGKPAD